MKISGIYKIQSIIKPQRCYIGSAVNIHKRWWNHAWELRNNRHHSIILQRHYNKYGEADLQFSVLLGCNKEDLVSIEQYFVDFYNPYFNINKITRRGYGMLGLHHSNETKLLQSRSHKGCRAWNKGTKGLSVSWNKTPICQFDKNGIFIKEWESAYMVQQELGISRSNIGHCINGERKTAGSFIWKYKNVS
jgi:hypothetical protein